MTRLRVPAVIVTIALLAGATLALAQSGPPPGLPPGGPPGGPPGEDDGAPNPFAPPPVPADAPVPSSNPRNLDGVWYHEAMLEFQITKDAFGYKTPFNAAGKKVMQRRVKSLKDGTPFINASTRCFPVGQPWQMDLNMPFRIVQSKARIEFLFEEYHGYMQVLMDAAKAPAARYMGNSVGHWDGDTLVVETTGFKDGLWLDVNGTPASKDAKLTQRIRKARSDHWYLEVEFTLDDPTYYTRPWSWMRDYSWRPDMAVFREYDCELQTGAKDGLDPSLGPEPQY
jgi:hypothetical protein